MAYTVREYETAEHTHGVLASVLDGHGPGTAAGTTAANSRRSFRHLHSPRRSAGEAGRSANVWRHSRRHLDRRLAITAIPATAGAFCRSPSLWSSVRNGGLSEGRR